MNKHKYVVITGASGGIGSELVPRVGLICPQILTSLDTQEASVGSQSPTEHHYANRFLGFEEGAVASCLLSTRKEGSSLCSMQSLRYGHPTAPY